MAGGARGSLAGFRLPSREDRRSRARRDRPVSRRAAASPASCVRSTIGRTAAPTTAVVDRYDGPRGLACRADRVRSASRRASSSVRRVGAGSADRQSSMPATPTRARPTTCSSTPSARMTRACAYDRAGGVGCSDAAPLACRDDLPDLVGDLEALLEAGELSPPYVMVGSSGRRLHLDRLRREASGRTWPDWSRFDTFAPDPDPPPEVVEETDPNHPDNAEHRDYLKVENQAWNAKRAARRLPGHHRHGAVSEGRGGLRPQRPERQPTRRAGSCSATAAEQRRGSPPHEVVEDDPELAERVRCWTSCARAPSHYTS